MADQILDEQEVDFSFGRRRDLLPKWIKVFIWIFMFFGLMVPVALFFGVTERSFGLSLYGIETNAPFSPYGVLVLFLFLIKALVSIGLWFEKDWAVKLAIGDAWLGILLCIVVMFVLPLIYNSSGFNINLRLEVVVLIPYLQVMKRIRSDWESTQDTALV